MKIKDKIFSLILILIIILLILVVGTFGYTIYNGIMGEGNIQLNFGGETSYPTIEFKKTKEETNMTETNSIVYGGVNDGKTTNVDINRKNGHLYNQLDKNAKIIYTQLYSNKENLKTGIYTIEFGNVFYDTLSKENGDKELQSSYQSAIEALLYENPEIFYLDATNMYINIEKITKITGIKYNVYINKGTKTSYLAEGFYTEEDVSRCENEIEQVKKQVLAMVEGKSDYDKIKIIHDYLIDTIEYDSTILQENIYNIYGALVSKKSVCEGYAKAFQYLMNEVGIDNAIVIGTATNSKNETENHAWNYVKMNEQWYAIDVTWDDPIIIGNGKLTNKMRYQYFLKGSHTMNRNHTTLGNFTQGGQVFNYPTLSIEDYE